MSDLADLAWLTTGTVQTSRLAIDSINNGVWLWSSSNETSSLHFVNSRGEVHTWKLGWSDQERLPAVRPSIIALGGRAFLVVNSDLFVAGVDQDALLHYDLPHLPPSVRGQSVNQSKEWNPPISLAVSSNSIAVGYAASGDVAVASLSNLDSFSTYSMGESLINLSMAAFPSKGIFIGGFADLERETADVILRFDASGEVLHSDRGDSRQMYPGLDETVLVGVEELARYSFDGASQSVDTRGVIFDLGNSLVDGSDPAILSVRVSDDGFRIEGPSINQSIPYPPAKQCGAPSVPQGGESAEICNSRPVAVVLDGSHRLWAVFNPLAGEFVIRTTDLTGAQG